MLKAVVANTIPMMLKEKGYLIYSLFSSTFYLMQKEENIFFSTTDYI